MVGSVDQYGMLPAATTAIEGLLVAASRPQRETFARLARVLVHEVPGIAAPLEPRGKRHAEQEGDDEWTDDERPVVGHAGAERGRQQERRSSERGDPVRAVERGQQRGHADAEVRVGVDVGVDRRRDHHERGQPDEDDYLARSGEGGDLHDSHGREEEEQRAYRSEVAVRVLEVLPRVATDEDRVGDGGQHQEGEQQRARRPAVHERDPRQGERDRELARRRARRTRGSRDRGGWSARCLPPSGSRCSEALRRSTPAGSRFAPPARAPPPPTRSTPHAAPREPRRATAATRRPRRPGPRSRARVRTPALSTPARSIPSRAEVSPGARSRIRQARSTADSSSTAISPGSSPRSVQKTRG